MDSIIVGTVIESDPAVSFCVEIGPPFGVVTMLPGYQQRIAKRHGPGYIHTIANRGILLNRDYQDDFSPFLLAGSGTVKEVTKTEEKYQDYPECIETSLNPGVLSGLKTSAELLHGIIEEARRHAENLTRELRKQISELSSVYLPEEILNNPRTHITGFYFSSLTAHEVAVFLDEIKKVDIRSGSFCAHQLVARVLSGIETEGAMQCAFHYYNQFSDVEYLVNSITECLRTFGIDH